MYTTPFTTAGDEESTSLPSCASQLSPRKATLLAPMVVSKGFLPVWCLLKRNCLQSTSVVPADEGSEVSTIARHTAAATRMGALLMVDLRRPAGSSHPDMGDTVARRERMGRRGHLGGDPTSRWLIIDPTPSRREDREMASKDKGGNKGSKKAATQTLKEKRQAKKAKQAAKGR
jgi:hypothetical protein